MLSRNQASDLHAALHDPEFRKTLQEFVAQERIYCVQKAMDCIRANNLEESRNYAAQDQVYSELIEKLKVFAERELKRH